MSAHGGALIHEISDAQAMRCGKFAVSNAGTPSDTSLFEKYASVTTVFSCFNVQHDLACHRVGSLKSILLL